MDEHEMQGAMRAFLERVRLTFQTGRDIKSVSYDSDPPEDDEDDWNITVYLILSDETKREGYPNGMLPTCHIDIEEVRKLFDPGKGTHGFGFRMVFNYCFAERENAPTFWIFGQVGGREVSLTIVVDPDTCERCGRHTAYMRYCDRCDREICRCCVYEHKAKGGLLIPPHCIDCVVVEHN